MSSPLSVRVRSITYLAEDILAYELRALDGSDLPGFAAGAHIDVHLPNDLGRSYSLINDPRERHRYVIAVARDRASRGGSVYLHDAVRPGAVLTIDAPRNTFPLNETATETLLIAGGIGVTPMLSMIDRLEALKLPWRLVYCVRSRAAAAFLDDLAAYGDRVTIRADDEEEGAFVDVAALVAAAQPGTHFYCCGPNGMLDAFAGAVAGMPEAQVHREYFHPAEEAATDGGFVVELARTGITVSIGAGQTILEALEAAGLDDLPHSCREGVCGSCEAQVLEGVPDHRDSVLTPSERARGDVMMICCSGAKTPKLILDL